ncbi:helix-turn-helix domain-containing protein [Aureibacter tunicatorum]|uniref:AraC-like DNA-binding protein n=1 Tax=Aureibacter tunicatorum TaxID=866807 RepID=A0AAE3XM38_9BACT|nr:helix-turn-helix transcriptional regulator [Aureibacter tunicatorum]MDR6240426.1 AraC-like DNA-binding protein [Aureibacter tunicatorum]BDD05695.1 transcriptional regulator [Aureibacter tunicatorum]
MHQPLDIKDKSSDKNSIKVEAFRKHVRTTKPHKHNNYFELIFLSQGHGTHAIDQEKIDIQPPMVFGIGKEQIHYWDMDAEPEGYVMIFRSDFIMNSHDKALLELANELFSHSHILLSKDESITQFFSLLAKELKELTVSPYVVEGLLKALFGKILQMALHIKPTQDKSKNLYQQLVDLLIENKEYDRKVENYAELLNTTPQNLNAICRKIENLTASEVIAAHIVKEAKRLLAHSNSSISEIAFHLNFKDSSHFVKYFKRHAQVTPGAFRSSSLIEKRN